jgi:DNA-binding MarR family transcriptional regulator
MDNTKKKKWSTKQQKQVPPYYRQRMSWAMMARHGLSASQRLVLMVIASRCNNAKPYESKISRAWVAEVAGVSIATVDRAIKALVDKKLIQRNIWKRSSKYVRKRTILEWAAIQRDQLCFKEPESAEAAADAALEPRESVAADAALKPHEILPPGDAEQDADLDDDDLDDLDLNVVEDALEPKTAPKATPKTMTTKPPTTTSRKPLQYDDTRLYDDEPQSKPSTAKLSERAIIVLTGPDGMVALAQARGADFERVDDEVDGSWFDAHAAAYCKKHGLVAAQVEHKRADGSTGTNIRVALPFPDYVAKRLSEHSGKRVPPTATATFRRFESGPDPYCVLEYALATENWCTLIRNARTPGGLLYSQFEPISEQWSDAGGFWYETPVAVAAQQPSPDAAAQPPTAAAATAAA